MKLAKERLEQKVNEMRTKSVKLHPKDREIIPIKTLDEESLRNHQYIIGTTNNSID
jgi:hypothetical protein